MDYIKKNITFVIALSIPFFMILFVSGSIYLPTLWSQPKYSFIYAEGDYMNGLDQYLYGVRDGRLIENSSRKADYSVLDAPSKPKLYKYDVGSDSSKELSFQDSQNFILDSSEMSPDGYKVIRGNQDRGFFSFVFFTSSDSESFYLKGGAVSKKININKGSGYWDFRFIGWLK